MRVQCVQVAVEIKEPFPEVIVFPEYCEIAELTKARNMCTDSIIVGAVVEEDQHHIPRGRGILFHRGGANQIDYLKIETDSSGASIGTEKVPAVLPIYESASICIGVLICMDVSVELEAFSRAVTDEVRSRRAAFKLICIPAAMNSDWNWSSLGAKYRDLHVVLSNSQTKSYQPRHNSFIAFPNGLRVEENATNWPISADIEFG